GRRAGIGASNYVASLAQRPTVVEEGLTVAQRRALAPFERDPALNAYTVQAELQQTMNDLVGIIREQGQMERALQRVTELAQRAETVGIAGHRQYNPGWNLALDLRNLLLVSECVARSALLRTESRGGHTRDDYPEMDAEWRHTRLGCSFEGAGEGSGIRVTRKAQDPMRADLLELFELDELAKYYTGAELAGHSQRKG